jgi:acetyltransferase-like isoleucine patch superfamily enzyme
MKKPATSKRIWPYACGPVGGRLRRTALLAIAVDHDSELGHRAKELDPSVASASNSTYTADCFRQSITMPIDIIDRGENNVIDVDPDHLEHGDGHIILNGSGNTVRIGKPQAYGRISIQLWHNSRVTIESGCEFHLLRIFAPRGAAVNIGERTVFNGIVELHMTEDRGVTIGKRCLIGAETFFWPSDMHSVVSVETGRRINPPEDIVLGDRVWVAARSIVLKGSRIGSGSIVGAGAVLTGEVPENCVAAGNPARVIKRDVTWDQELLAIEPIPPEQQAPSSKFARMKESFFRLRQEKAAPRGEV